MSIIDFYKWLLTVLRNRNKDMFYVDIARFFFISFIRWIAISYSRFSCKSFISRHTPKTVFKPYALGLKTWLTVSCYSPIADPQTYPVGLYCPREFTPTPVLLCFVNPPPVLLCFCPPLPALLCFVQPPWRSTITRSQCLPFAAWLY